MTHTVSALVVARDEADMIDGCLDRLGFADEVVVVVDDRTTDDTAERARRHGASVSTEHFESFASLKNAGIERCRSEWVLVVDADERVTAQLAAEVRLALAGSAVAYRIPIQNYFFGGRIRFGGWRERPVRLFRREGIRYEGDIHETLRLPAAAPVADLDGGLAHFSHRSIAHNLAKTSAYADIQAAEMLRQGHPPVTARTLFRVVLGEVWRRLLRGRGFRDGMPGVIESLYQPFSMMVVYVRLWELQQQPDLAERYRQLDRTVE
ncbi:MAG: glycosyltransferase [Actinobacteria bacterium]|nr:glycosyltransferase [Actinomycetota bacterium]